MHMVAYRSLSGGSPIDALTTFEFIHGMVPDWLLSDI